MSIHDFHSKLSSRNENNVLFEALRQLRGLKDFRSILFLEDTSAGGGWYPWMDGHEHHRNAVAEG
jgi:DNA-binding GntR family transcriptional regulator